ncbi:hypothetical protein PG985_012365 [Apiospora marii]|uniref:Uncharacterized protein n=1 Tax=Apiospora marii TaxID=335849 RepID=A0ABR1RFI0_9PEZI
MRWPPDILIRGAKLNVVGFPSIGRITESCKGHGCTNEGWFEKHGHREVGDAYLVSLDKPLSIHATKQLLGALGAELPILPTPSAPEDMFRGGTMMCARAQSASQSRRSKKLLDLLKPQRTEIQWCGVEALTKSPPD